MPKSILISLPVTDLPRSLGFYKAMGFTQNPQFSGESSAFLVLNEVIQLVLLTHDEWKNLTTRPIPPSTSSEVGLALYVDSRAKVDALHSAAVAHGGTADINPIEDFPFLYGRDFTDPDGHVWGAKWFDPAMAEASTQTPEVAS